MHHLKYVNRETSKVLYAKARQGLIKGFTGIDAPYEAPLEAAVEVQTDMLGIEEAVDKIFEFLLPRIKR